ncbi:hypothetical protein OH76DRAFT_1487986 [Lentinus brumalis]|uniref:Uncharacterized protein n=1 Tax=Lentinus brumalis TaxID=2498619 RepID=A0A371CSM5_9APHY|nr:hypothetical protein OH76DRAFT_1487986 [Polyporus brumalis]
MPPGLTFYPLSVIMKAPERRAIYLATLESAHIDSLHEQLLIYSTTAVPFEMPYVGLDDRTAKVRLTCISLRSSANPEQSMISVLQHDTTEIKLKLLELERANMAMERVLSNL